MLKKLENKLKELGKVAIAYSGGIDSSFLLYIANTVLSKKNVIAVIANGSMIPRKDYDEAIQFLVKNEFQYKEVQYNPFDILEFRENHIDRCYYCKKELMNKIKKVSEDLEFKYLLDGKNVDDLSVYRPGNIATTELGIISPLADLNFSKNDIRKLSKELGIKFWNKPSNSCLATRFPYNTILIKENLRKSELSEEIIRDLGIKEVRVRIHRNIARIEVNTKDFEIILKNEKAIQKIKNLGFDFVTLDLLGLKKGSFDIVTN